MKTLAAGPLMVLGSLNADQVLQVPRISAAGHTVAAQGMQMLDGGKGGNQAVAAARMGAGVRMVGCVGADAAGQQLRAGLEREGVDVSHLRTVAGVSGMAVVQVDAQGRNAIVVVAGANAAVLPADVEEVLSTSPEAATATWLAQLEVPADTVWYMVRRVSMLGGSCVLNPSPMAAVPHDVWPLLGGLVVNEHEAAELLGQAIGSVADGLQAASALHRRGPAWVALTLGAQGVCLATPALGAPSLHQPARPVEVVDTTGAGDAYAGALLAGLIQGLELPAASARAQQAAALCVTRMGAQAALAMAHELP